MLGAQPQERERQADLVVPVALAPERREAPAEDRRDRFLRGRLGDAARDPDDERSEAPAPRRGQRPEGEQAVAHEDDGHVAERFDRGGVEWPAHDERPGPRAGGAFEEGVPVGALARQGHEGLPGLDLARVDGPAADRPTARAQEAAARDAGDIGGREGGPGDRSPQPRQWVGHARKCGIAHAHGRIGPAAVWPAGGRSRVAIASVATRR